jgi:hypothetical protein
LNGEELKELCSAAKLKVSGKKEELINRLSENSETSRFAMEQRVLSRPTIFNCDRDYEFQSGSNHKSNYFFTIFSRIFLFNPQSR